MSAQRSQADHDAVLAANAAFYRAFESLDLTHMEEVWLRAAHVKCVHPGWGRLVGWGPVMESWQRIFANTVAMRFTLTATRVEVVGDLAWVVLTENLESQHRAGSATARVEATNIFQRHDGRWFLVHHHGSPVYTPGADSGPEQMH
ncbi:MAG TPA: nuclear transport factor 2 family protein [Candidatus Margulisiibacteriota bacterium]|nr:nuclear transport factor 2 family protein [Candidatus Margulisiibacteriota bacterium]